MLDQILGNTCRGVHTRSKVNNFCKYSSFISKIKPKTISDALLDEGWLTAIQEDLIQFKQNDVWDLVPRPSDKIVTDTRWVFRNKFDENGIVTRNKVGPVAKRYIVGLNK